MTAPTQPTGTPTPAHASQQALEPHAARCPISPTSVTQVNSKACDGPDGQEGQTRPGRGTRRSRSPDTATYGASQRPFHPSGLISVAHPEGQDGEAQGQGRERPRTPSNDPASPQPAPRTSAAQQGRPAPGSPTSHSAWMTTRKPTAGTARHRRSRAPTAAASSLRPTPALPQGQQHSLPHHQHKPRTPSMPRHQQEPHAPEGMPSTYTSPTHEVGSEG